MPKCDLGKRQLLLSAAAACVAGCADGLQDAPPLRDADATDPLLAWRLPTDADVDVWERHLNFETMRNAPQVLAISGGGEDGAFGAGILTGWSVEGSRPAFDLVTGISTGALIAPFAFVGEEQDGALKRIFTEHDADDVIRRRGLPGLFGDAVYDTAPMRDLIEDYVSDDVLRAVANRHQAGARLLVVTSDIDTNRAKAWNMGAIAAAGQSTLFREIMRASSALPGIFPPVTLSFSADGQRYQETHVDGGLHMQLLAVPSAAFQRTSMVRNGGHLYLLINNTLEPAPERIPRNVLRMSQHAITTMVRSSAAATVDTAQLLADRDGLDLSVATINPDANIVFDPQDRFSATYMRTLFGYGYERAVRGNAWSA